MAEQYTIEDFAQRIKSTYPQYRDIPDAELTGKILAKYPQYKSNIIPAGRDAASRSEFESNKPDYTQPGFAPVKTVLDAPLDFGIGLEKALGIDPMHPIASLPSAAVGAATGIYNLVRHPLDTASSVASSFMNAVHAGGNAIRGQNLPEALQSVGEGYVAAKPIEGIVETAGKLGPGALRERARKIAQSATGATAEKTTLPIAKTFTEDTATAAKKQAAVDQRTADLNAQRVATADAKNAKNAVDYKQKLDKLRSDFATKQASVNKSIEEKTAAFKQETAQTLEQNRKSAIDQSRAEALERGVTEGSKRLGERVRDLDTKLRTEAGEKYAEVRNAVKDDPGVPIEDIGNAVQHAEQNILKGSSESLKQFRDILTKEEAVGEGTPAKQPFSETGELPFDQLQGYSSEIGMKLAKGGLSGDVYQALKYLKGKVDAAKNVIADRNGVGGSLRSADSFWNRYMDAFYDADSPVARVRESVGVLDPQFYAEPFTKGKSAEVGISKLRSLKTRHGADASAIADLAQNLRKAIEERSVLKPGKEQALPARPKLPEQPSPVTEPAAPAMVTPKVTTPRQIERPAVPTAEQIQEAKAGKVMSKGQSFLEMKPRDAFLIAGPIIGGLLGSRTLEGIAAGLGIEGAVKGFGYALTRPRIIEWISRPTEADIAALKKMPADVQRQIGDKLRKVIDEEKAAKRPIAVAPSVAKIVSAGPVANRREAMERLGQPVAR